MRISVGIVGAGPAGLTLALMLAAHGVESAVVESRSREYVERRVRAGLLEHNTVDVIRSLGAAARLDREALVHRGLHIRWPGHAKHIDIERLTGRYLTVYGQQELVKDLIAIALERGVDVRFEMPATAIRTDGDRAAILCDGGVIDCDFVVGCDGFHGITRASLPPGASDGYEREYPFDWLGVLARAAPANDELVYAWHPHGFALQSMRSPTVSRLYLQVPRGEDLDAWPDDRVWAELRTRLEEVNEGPVLDKGLTPMRSYVCEPLQHGNLFLAGDAAHIVPPTGAKGLNLAVNDARILATALADWYHRRDRGRLDRYSVTALRRVWRAQDFSNYMTELLHQLGQGAYTQRLQLSRLDHLARSAAAESTFAENYVGLPATDDF